MKICVLIKQVPGSESAIQPSSDGKWIDEAGLPLEMNESDNYALEEALQLKEKNGDGEVIVVSMGPDRCLKTMREGLAKGADRAIYIKEEAPLSTDPFTIANTLANAIKDESPDLVLSGLQTDDYGFGQTGIILGEILGMTTASLVMATELQDGKIKVKRELEAGWSQWQIMSLPSSITIQSGLNQPRYPSLKGIMGAKKKEIKEFSFNDINTSEPLQSFNTLSIQRAEKQTEMIDGNADQVVAKLVDVFKNNIKIL